MSSQIDRNMMVRNMMGQDTMGRNMLGQDNMGRNMIDRNNMIARQEMTPNMMYSNMIGQDMTNTQMALNMMSSHGMMDSRSDNGLMGQGMMQKMEIERVPETYMSTRFF